MAPIENKHPIVLFDGVCNLCEGAVIFLIKRDKAAVLKFASLQSHTGQMLLSQHGLDKDHFDSFILAEGGQLYLKSKAALKTAGYLPLPWRLLRLFTAVPRPVRDAIYTLIARNRYRWFGRKESCMIPSPSLKERFLD
ncbi:thiol-disulfide oxidoreductase DCC family protein [Metabacillus sp. 84]|uniref:thiol-disulfide oxidoreductase DCC family protein n=1 Tax=unclassified Metabacillus TaxID=2675274 RepID=UPI003CF6DE21